MQSTWPVFVSLFRVLALLPTPDSLFLGSWTNKLARSYFRGRLALATVPPGSSPCCGMQAKVGVVVCLSNSWICDECCGPARPVAKSSVVEWESGQGVLTAVRPFICQICVKEVQWSDGLASQLRLWLCLGACVRAWDGSHAEPADLWTSVLRIYIRSLDSYGQPTWNVARVPN